MKYHFTFPDRVSRFAKIELSVDGLDGEEVEFCLPSWRPGRYELGNFAKNIRSWKALGDDGHPLPFRKKSKDVWIVSLGGSKSVKVRYDYYCAQPDAGACWIDEELVYINPIHCCLYLPERMHEPCIVHLALPEDYSVACSLDSPSHGIFHAVDFHELVDSPWMASATLQTNSYELAGIQFHIWFHGNISPDWDKILHDFRRFTEVQLQTMGGFPVKNYHFLVLALPFRFYHGVEHLRSTVLALGPAEKLMESPLYDDFTGVASHELFHVWNIKSIRPAEMLPYDYSVENYSRLGYVYEGVTTYYGDLFLVRCGVYSHAQYFDELNVRLQRHFDSHARFHLPVADASFDTWLDGYVSGIPHRKTSIYDEGSLVALMTDLFIRRATSGKASLDDVMLVLYEDFGKRKIGYSESDYIAIVERVCGQSMSDFFVDYVYGTENYETLFVELLDEVGCDLVRKPSLKSNENKFGFRVTSEGSITRVTSVLPGSLAEHAGVGKEDEIVAVNGIKVESNLHELLSGDDGRPEVVTLMTPMKKLKDVVLTPGLSAYYHRYSICPRAYMSDIQRAFFESWLGNN